MPDHRNPDLTTIRTAVAMALRAPSAHNAQPWQWRIGYSTLHLFADPEPRPPESERDRRDLVLGCGAALHHLRVGFGALGWATTVHRLPDAADPGHLAVVTPRRDEPSEPDVVLAAAIPHRRSDRRPHGSWPVPREHLAALSGEADREGVRLRVLDRSSAGRVTATIADGLASAAGHQSPGRSPAGAAVLTRPAAPPTTAPDNRGTVLLALSTPGDDTVWRLRAGEATSAVLLRATALGLASCALTEPLATPEARAVLKDVVTDDGVPQVLLRVGWAPANAAPLPSTPRRGLAYVLEPLQAPPKYHHRTATG